AGNHESPIQARTGFGQRRRLGIEIDVIGDEQVEMAVAVVIEKSAAGVPALRPGGCSSSYASFGSHIGERAISVVAVQRAVAPVGNEQVVDSIVVVVAHTDTLTPTCPHQPRASDDVGDMPVPVDLLPPVGWRGALGL